MLDLIRYIIRNGSFFLFLFFEFAALYLVVNYNATQQTIFFNTSNRITGLMYEKMSEVKDYFRLSRINDDLNDENAFLLKQIDELSFKANQRSLEFDYFAAKVISNRTDGRYNRFLIDKGRRDGIHEGMGIIYKEHPVGIIYQVTDHYAGAISLINTNFHLSAGIRRSRSFGTMTWDPGQPLHAMLYHIPAHVDLNVGDTVATSGYSHIFPANLPIGLIDDITTPKGSHLYEIRLQLLVDIGSIDYVHVVENMQRQELDSLFDDQGQ